MRGFLWCSGTLTVGKAKVAWSTVCKPKDEGGLGLKRIRDMNVALLSKHIFLIISRNKSLWVNWVYAYHIKDGNFWQARIPSSCCWSWRSIMKIRPMIRNLLWMEIGNGELTSIWYDRWCHASPLCNWITPRQIHNAGFSLQSKIADVCVNDQWIWPVAWRDLFPMLIDIPAPTLSYKNDNVVIKLGSITQSFSTAIVWQAVRDHMEPVNWSSLVWNSFSIPRHSFILWLICNRKLKTQDRILAWSRMSGSMNLSCCLLCRKDIDSHDHLFFQCEFSKTVWKSIQDKANIFVTESWDEFIEYWLPKLSLKRIDVVIAKLILAATAYYIWQERNARFFNNRLRPPETIVEIIFSTVRLKLMSLQFKSRVRVRHWLRLWKIDDQDLRLLH